MRHSKTGKTAYFQLKNVIFNTNTILEEVRENRTQPRDSATYDLEIQLRKMQIIHRIISTSQIEI